MNLELHKTRVGCLKFFVVYSKRSTDMFLNIQKIQIYIYQPSPAKVASAQQEILSLCLLKMPIEGLYKREPSAPLSEHKLMRNSSIPDTFEELDFEISAKSKNLWGWKRPPRWLIPILTHLHLVNRSRAQNVNLLNTSRWPNTSLSPLQALTFIPLKKFLLSLFPAKSTAGKRGDKPKLI